MLASKDRSCGGAHLPHNVCIDGNVAPFVVKQYKTQLFTRRIVIQSDVDRVEFFRLTLRFFDNVSTAS